MEAQEQEQFGINAEEITKQNSSNTIDREVLENTPFTVVKLNEEYFGAIGKYRITKMYKTREEVEAKLQPNDWETLLNVVIAVNEMYNKNK